MGIMKGMEFYTPQSRLAPLGCKLHMHASQTNPEASYEPSRWVLRIPCDQSRSANTMSSCNQVESFGGLLRTPQSLGCQARMDESDARDGWLSVGTLCKWQWDYRTTACSEG